MKILGTIIIALVFLAVGFGAGVWFAPQLASAPMPTWVTDTAASLPFSTPLAKPDPNSPFENYAYPKIKWRAKPLADIPGAIAQLSTTYEGTPGQQGVMKYRLTMFKAAGKQSCEVQLLDGDGYKLAQINAGDFHPLAGAPDIVEARDDYGCTEDVYKKVRDYSIK